MVARINTGKSISKALNYNEKKLQEGQAECLLAVNFLKDADKMNFYDKLRSFQKLTTLNEKATTNTLHVSLNFDPAEKLESNKLVEIAKSYMIRIGFENQPYIIYRHFDTGHPHIHIVSTNIQTDGSRISMHNMGRNQSEIARKEIEIEFGLIKAESKKLLQDLKLKPINAQKINPGKRSTKAAISNVLGIVIPQYKYSSLAELNAILKLYNVVADRCGENSHVYKHKGLLYRVLDEKGNKTGTPIKASLFYMKPTLENLEKNFAVNEKLKPAGSARLIATINYALEKMNQGTLQQFINYLQAEKVSVVLRKNINGLMYGITYVDHRTKSVFNGSDLGKKYSAKSILELTGKKPNIPFENEGALIKQGHPGDNSGAQNKEKELTIPVILVNTAPSFDYVPYQLKKKRKTKKKKQKRL